MNGVMPPRAEYAPPGLLRLAWLLARLAGRRILNQTLAAFQKKKSKKGLEPEASHPSAPQGRSALRSATPRKSKGSLLALVFIAGIMLFNVVFNSVYFVSRLSGQLENNSASAGPVPLAPETFMYVKTAEEALRQADALPAEQRPAERQHWRDYLRSLFRHHWESTLGVQEEQDASVRTEESLDLFDRKGSAGFQSADRPSRVLHGPAWPSAEAAPYMVGALGLLYLLLGVSIVCTSLAGSQRGLSQGDWSMEWLFTFPVSSRGLFLARLGEYALTNVWCGLMIFPLTGVIYWMSGYGAWGLLLALGSTLYLSFQIASLQLAAETWLRKHLTVNRLRNVQALVALAGAVLLLAALGMTLRPSLTGYLFDLAERLSGGATWNPFSVPMLLCGSGGAPGPGAALMLGWLLLLPWLSVSVCEKLVRDGLFTSTGTLEGKRKRPKDTRASIGKPQDAADPKNERLAPTSKPPWIRGIVAKELRLLGRDRNFFVQTLVVPALIVGMQAAFNPGLSGDLSSHFRHAAMFAFGAGAYMLLFGGFSVLTSEGPALWLLYSFPRELNAILLDKARLWCGFAVLYAALVMGAAAALGAHLDLQALSDATLVLVGVGIYAFMAAALGTLGSDPLETNPKRRVRPEFMYLYMLLASMYAHALYSPAVWPKLVLIVLCALTALALWQKVKDHLPYCLDPTAEPPPRISLADGLMAVMGFFVLQGLCSILLVVADAGLSPLATLLIAFASAGVLVTFFTLYVFWRTKVPALLTQVGLVCEGAHRLRTWARSAALGLLLGLAAAAAGAVYLWALDHFEPLRALKDQFVSPAARSSGGDSGWFVALAVLAAPVFEEYIFRGLVYGGLRRTVRPALAIPASAAVFAIVHPPLAVVPVFGLGVAAAFCFERTQLLIGPMFAHAVYNAAMVFLALGKS